MTDDAWYSEAALWCNSKGYITGVADHEFAPDSKLTRAMAVQILARVALGDGLSSYNYSGKFGDVKSSDWYAKAVEWAVQNEITYGTGPNTFSPKSPVTREQFAGFLYAFARSKGKDVSAAADLSGYKDTSSISSWAVKFVKWAVAKKLISGTSATTLSPKQTTTRAQAAVIIKNFVEKILNKN